MTSFAEEDFDDGVWEELDDEEEEFSEGETQEASELCDELTDAAWYGSHDDGDPDYIGLRRVQEYEEEVPQGGEDWDDIWPFESTDDRDDGGEHDGNKEPEAEQTAASLSVKNLIWGRPTQESVDANDYPPSLDPGYAPWNLQANVLRLHVPQNPLCRAKECRNNASVRLNLVRDFQQDNR